MNPRRRSRISGQFAARPIEMLRSPAMGELSLSGRRILDRLEIELADHGGKDNGRLPVTFDDFQRFGIDRHAIAPGLREAEALGFMETVVRGVAGNAEFRSPSLYRITWRATDHAKETNEWSRITTAEVAQAIANAARKTPQRPRRNQKPSGGLRPVSMGETHTETAAAPVGEPHTTGSVGKPPPLSISRVGSGYQGSEPTGHTSIEQIGVASGVSSERETAASNIAESDE